MPESETEKRAYHRLLYQLGKLTRNGTEWITRSIVMTDLRPPSTVSGNDGNPHF